MRFTPFGKAAVAIAALGAVAAVSVWNGTSGHAHSDTDYVFAHMQARNSSADMLTMETSFAETLPTKEFSINGAPAKALSSGVVIGHVAQVRSGRGFSHKDDAPSSTETGFSSPDALWRTVEVTVTVEEAWGRVAGPKQLTFAVIIDGKANAAAAMNGLRSLDRIIVTLDRQGRYRYAPELYNISHNGNLLGTVDAAGNIRLPVMEHAEQFMKGLDTVDELRAELTKPPAVIKVDLVQGIPVRR